MGTSPKIYKVAEGQQPGESEAKEFNIYDPERMERIRRFLSAKNSSDGNQKTIIDQYRPPTYDCMDFTVNVSPQTLKRFIVLYNSNLCLKMLMTFEKYYLGNNLDNRKTFERQAFLMEHVSRIREIYRLAIMFDNLIIRDYADFKHLALFFEQIEYFICYEINQIEPMGSTDLKNKIFNTFYDLCSDITEISSFEDIQKILDVKLIPYHFERGQTSLQPLNEAPKVYTFDLSIIDQETKESLFENFTNEDFQDLFEPGLISFVEDPLNFEEYRDNNHLFNPFSGIIDQQADQPF